MRTLDEHNLEKNFHWASTSAGVTCPKCKTELKYRGNPSMVLLTYPPRQSVFCPDCGFTGYKQI